MKTKNIFLLMLIFTLNIFALNISTPFSFANTKEAARIATKAKVELEVKKDLALPYSVSSYTLEHTAIDGRSLTDFKGDIIEYWVNLECTYCRVSEPLQAQRDNENIRIVVRHIPTKNYGESLKKALSYEALKKFSANAANTFWDKVIPKTSLAIPVPYESSLLLAFQEANMEAEAFAAALSGHATKVIDADIMAAQGKIFSTPTYVIEGIRFPACNFTAKELLIALDLAKKARQGDSEAVEKIIHIITNGLSNVPIFDPST